MSETVYWMVVHEDTHGNRDLHKSRLSEEEADEILRHFTEVNERKPHKQEYYKFPYTAASKLEVLQEQRVRL